MSSLFVPQAKIGTNQFDKAKEVYEKSWPDGRVSLPQLACSQQQHMLNRKRIRLEFLVPLCVKPDQLALTDPSFERRYVLGPQMPSKDVPVLVKQHETLHEDGLDNDVLPGSSQRTSSCLRAGASVRRR